MALMFFEARSCRGHTETAEAARSVSADGRLRCFLLLPSLPQTRAGGLRERLGILATLALALAFALFLSLSLFLSHPSRATQMVSGGTAVLSAGGAVQHDESGGGSERGAIRTEVRAYPLSRRLARSRTLGSSLRERAHPPRA